MRRYRAGCRCDSCRDKNTAEKAKYRERKRARDGKPSAPRSRNRAVPTVTTAPPEPAVDVVPSGGAADEPPTTVSGALKIALDKLDADDDLAVFRKLHAIQLATVLDDSSKPHLWRGITSALAEVIGGLIAGKPAGEGEADELLDFLAEIGNSRRR